MATLGRVAIDGSKIRANTSRHKAMSHRRMREAEARLEDEIAQIVAQIEELNAAEDEEHGEDDDGSGGLPAELRQREQRRERIRKARAQLEAEKGAKLEPTHQKSFADPEANMMKTGAGALEYCYNAQAATSAEGVIVANDLSEKVNDQTHLAPLLEAIEENTGERAALVLADQGYLSEANLKLLEARRQRALIAVAREGKRASRWPRGARTRRMHRILRLPWAQERYAHRKTQGERPFAEIKARQRFGQFMLRGKAKVRGEWDLVCAAFNVSLLWRAAAT
jgi:hypothetical protein